MGSISGVSGMRNAWLQFNTQGEQRPDKPFAGAAADNSSDDPADPDTTASDTEQTSDTSLGSQHPFKTLG